MKVHSTVAATRTEATNQMRPTQGLLSLLRLYERAPLLPKGRGVLLAALKACDAMGFAPPLVHGPEGTKWEFFDEVLLRAIFRHGAFEPETVELLTSHCPAGGVLIDVGANIGYFTVLASRQLGPSGRVIAVEPMPPTQDRLRRHLALNECGNVTLCRAACSVEPGEARMKAKADSGWAVLDDSGTVVTPVTTVDRIVAEQRLTRVDLLKIDTEGRDLDVLRGAGATLDRFRPTVHMEVHHLHEFGQSPEEAMAFLQSHRYECRLISGDESVDLLAVPA